MAERKQDLSELLDRALRSETCEAWEALVAYLQPVLAPVIAHTARQLGTVTSDMVEEFTQEMFLKLCQGRFALLRTRGRTEEETIGFIKVTAINLVRDAFRAGRTQKRLPAGGFSAESGVEKSLGETQTADGIERRVLLGEIDAALTGAVSRRDRLIFWLHHRHGMTSKEISAISLLHLTEKGVESILLRLKNLVKEQFATVAE